MEHPERISSTFLSLYGRVGVETRGLHGEEEGKDRWFEERGREIVSSLDNERTVCLSRSDPNVLRVKITKPNIVGINLYPVFVCSIFCVRVSVQFVVVTVVIIIGAGVGLLG